MATILFAWELGGGLGHVGPMERLATALTGLGHKAVFAVKDVALSRQLLGRRWPVFQAPMGASAARSLSSGGAGSYADILAVRGFADADELEPQLLTWMDLIDQLRPDLLIADHSPTALLACYGIVPSVIVGYGFYVPPHHLPALPTFRDGVAPVATERAILEAIRTVQARSNRPAPETLPKLFAGRHVHCYSVRELDPYAEFRAPGPFGPIEDRPGLHALPKPPALFAYLSGGDPRSQDIATALAELSAFKRVPVHAYVRSANQILLRFLARSGVRIYDRPPPLAQVISDATAVLSHGGGGITHAALFAGRAQIVSPSHIEAHLTASRLQTLGAGAGIDGRADAAGIRDLISHALSSRALQDNAMDLASSVRARLPGGALEHLVEACRALL